MEKAYRHHSQFCGDGGCSHLALLLGYSIECGLKALIMRDRNVEEYNDLPEEYQVHHDFVLALTHLHAPPELQAITQTKVETLHASLPSNECYRRTFIRPFVTAFR